MAVGRINQPLWAFSGTLWQQLLENKVLGIDILCFPPTQCAHVLSLFHRGQLAGALLVHGLSSPSVGSERSSQGTDYIYMPSSLRVHPYFTFISSGTMTWRTNVIT